MCNDVTITVTFIIYTPAVGNVSTSSVFYILFLKRYKHGHRYWKIHLAEGTCLNPARTIVYARPYTPYSALCSLVNSLILKKEAVHSLSTPVNIYLSTRRHVAVRPETSSTSLL
jgi:hypothetical protein